MRLVWPHNVPENKQGLPNNKTIAVTVSPTYINNANKICK